LITLLGTNVNASARGLQDIASWIKGAGGLAVFVVGALLVDLVSVAVIIAVMSVLALALRPVNRIAERLSSLQARLNVTSNQELSTITMTAREIRVFGVGRAAGAMFRAAARDQRQARLRADMVSALTSPVFRTAGLLLIVAMIFSSAEREDVEITAVGLVAVLLYRSFTYGTMLVSTHQKLVQLVPVLDQLEHGLERLVNNPVRAGKREIDKFEHAEFRDVSYKYPGSHDPALVDFSARINAGEVVGVVGPSGAGKSTMAELLVSLRRPQAGLFELNGINATELTERNRSRTITLVSQSVPLVPGSLRDNVRFFRELDEGAIDRAIESAGLGEVIAGMPNGADSLIGPGARAVSGGQAQRIGIARALAAEPGLIVLDEPTSALDATAEAIVTDLIGSLRGSVAVVVIAHRLTTLRHCDRVLVVEDGAKTGEGSFAAVAQSNAFLKNAVAAGTLDFS
jgi:ABC-type multidrug transport system fused ATPase/permease subunit